MLDYLFKGLPILIDNNKVDNPLLRSLFIVALLEDNIKLKKANI